jgi:hypothetical protein
MGRGISATLRGLPATAIAFTGLVVVLDSTSLLLNSSYVRERPWWTAVWVMLGLGLLAALVLWRQQWAWWICLIAPIFYLASPAWGSRFHPVYDAFELAFLALLLTPSMRRHAGVLARGQQNQKASRGWIPSPGSVSLSIGGAIVLAVELETRHRATHTLGGEIFAGVLTWLVLAATIRFVIFIAQRCRQLVGRRDASTATEQ